MYNLRPSSALAAKRQLHRTRRTECIDAFHENSVTQKFSAYDHRGIVSFAQRPLDSRPMNTMNLVQETATWETEVLLAQGLGLECTMQVRKGCTKQRLSCLSSDPKHSSSEIHIVKRKQEKNILMKVWWTSDVLPTVESTKTNLFDTSSPHTGRHLGRSRDHRSAFTEEKSVDSRSVEVLSYACMARKSVFAKLAVADRSASTASENIDARNALAPPYAVMVEKNCYASNAMARRSAIMVSEKIFAESAGAHPYASMEGGDVYVKNVVVHGKEQHRCPTCRGSSTCTQGKGCIINRFVVRDIQAEPEPRPGSTHRTIKSTNRRSYMHRVWQRSIRFGRTKTRASGKSLTQHHFSLTLKSVVWPLELKVTYHSDTH